MARDDLFKKYQEAGADFIDSTRARAEELFRELARLSDATQRQARELREESLRGTDHLLDAIRREVASQLDQFGFLTGVETERVEHLLDEVEKRLRAALAAAWPSGSFPPGRKRPAKKAGGAKKSASAKKAGPKKSASAKKAGPKKSASAKKAGATGTTGATKKAAKKAAGAKKAAAKKAAPPPAASQP